MDATIYHQTKDWEHACVQTRRSLDKRKKRIQKFSIQKNEKILDLGCGDGLNIGILRDLGATKIVGVDISEELIKLAKKNNPKERFFVGSVEKLPFKNGEFDIIFVDSVFHHIIDYDKAIKEIYRVMKKGGKLCFIEPHRHVVRTIADFLCLLPISKFIPILNERREAYLGEINFMRHWLATEEAFYETLKKNKLKKDFHSYDMLSTVAQYRK